MNYTKIYNCLIEKFRTLNVEVGENHHIQPKCMGGNDNKTNIIRLPSREHFFAHQLLVKMYPKNIKLVYALNMMCVGDIRSRTF